MDCFILPLDGIRSRALKGFSFLNILCAAHVHSQSNVLEGLTSFRTALLYLSHLLQEIGNQSRAKSENSIRLISDPARIIVFECIYVDSKKTIKKFLESVLKS